MIAARYSTKDLSAKLENKKAVFQEFGLDSAHLDWPLFAMISRIDVQKGFDLLIGLWDYLLSKDLCFVLLGSGNKETEGHLRTVLPAIVQVKRACVLNSTMEWRISPRLAPTFF